MLINGLQLNEWEELTKLACYLYLSGATLEENICHSINQRGMNIHYIGAGIAKPGMYAWQDHKK